MAQSLKHYNKRTETTEESEQTMEDFKLEEASCERLENDEHKFTDPDRHYHGNETNKLGASDDGELNTGLFVYTFEKLSYFR